MQFQSEKPLQAWIVTVAFFVPLTSSSIDDKFSLGVSSCYDPFVMQVIRSIPSSRLVTILMPEPRIQIFGVAICDLTKTNAHIFFKRSVHKCW